MWLGVVDATLTAKLDHASHLSMSLMNRSSATTRQKVQ